jgi:hypothetical protein
MNRNEAIAAAATKTLYICMSMQLYVQSIQQGFMAGIYRTGYVGLRETIQDAFDRVRLFDKDNLTSDFMICAVTFSATGWMHFTGSFVNGQPVLSKRTYNDGNDWGVWHFQGDMPFFVHDARTHEVLLKTVWHPITS